MDNHRKLAEALLKADGIASEGATESERRDFGKMLDQQLKSKPSKPLLQPKIWRIFGKNAFIFAAAAACLLIGTLLWLITTGPISITLADVQESIASKTWVCIKYTDGAQQWANLPTKQSFYTERDKNNFYAGMRDHIKGVWTYYHSNHGQQIHEESFSPRPYPQTAWDYAVHGWQDTGKQLSDKIESFNDTINGQPVIRFDMVNIGPLGLRSIAQQIWANPQTRLPVRIRKYSGPEVFHEGDFSFPESGPLTIYDFGVSRDLRIVSNWGIIEPQAVAIIDTAKQAWHNLPAEIRIVEKNCQNNNFSVCYRLGNRLRRELYVPDNYTSVSLSLEPPDDPEQLGQWAHHNHLNLHSIVIFDGEHEYFYSPHNEIAAPFKAIMRVERRRPDWIDVLVSIREQWDFITNTGPMTVLQDQPGTPEGCILLRYDGADMKRDWILDPKRDYICVKQVQWNKNKSTNEWTEDPFFQQERTNLCRLSSGQWYAGTTLNQEGREVQFEVKLLTDAEKKRLSQLDKTTGYFDGEKLLNAAIEQKAKITYWVP